MMIRSDLEYRGALAELKAAAASAGAQDRARELREAIAAWDCANEMLARKPAPRGDAARRLEPVS